MSDLEFINGRVYFAPNIPEKKALKTIKQMGLNINISDIVMLYDSTIFGGGGEGLIVTRDKIFGKCIFADSTEETIGRISHVEIHKDALQINYGDMCDLTWIEKSERDRFKNLIIKFARNEIDIANTVTNKSSQPNNFIPKTSAEEGIIKNNLFAQIGINLEKSYSEGRNLVKPILIGLLENKVKYKPSVFLKPGIFSSGEDLLKANIALNYLCLAFTLPQFMYKFNNNELFSKIINNKFIFETILFLNYRTANLLYLNIEDQEVMKTIQDTICQESLLKLLIFPYVKHELNSVSTEGFKKFNTSEKERKIYADLDKRRTVYAINLDYIKDFNESHAGFFSHFLTEGEDDTFNMDFGTIFEDLEIILSEYGKYANQQIEIIVGSFFN